VATTVLNPTFKDAQWLSDHVEGEGMVVSCYSDTSRGDGIVLVEVEMSGRAEPRNYRIVGSRSGFDAAALDSVRAWRFRAPQAADAPDRLFVYAVVGFRAPLAPVTPRRE